VRQAIDLIESEKASLAALWVWHFPWQPDLTFDSKTHRCCCSALQNSTGNTPIVPPKIELAYR